MVRSSDARFSKTGLSSIVMVEWPRLLAQLEPLVPDEG